MVGRTRGPSCELAVQLAIPQLPLRLVPLFPIPVLRTGVQDALTAPHAAALPDFGCASLVTLKVVISVTIPSVRTYVMTHHHRRDVTYWETLAGSRIALPLLLPLPVSVRSRLTACCEEQ